MKYAAILMGLLSFSAFALTTDTLLLQGEVLEVLSIEVVEETVADSLDLATGQTNLLVAQVREISNSDDGYTVSISSANGGVLAHTNTVDTFAYTLKYNGVVLDLSSTVSQPHTAATAVNVNKAVRITYTGIPAEEMLAGVYSDTITFTIAAN